jgi:hypothetical protein
MSLKSQDISMEIFIPTLQTLNPKTYEPKVP